MVVMFFILGPVALCLLAALVEEGIDQYKKNFKTRG
jgi:hypothetical protein